MFKTITYDKKQSDMRDVAVSQQVIGKMSIEVIISVKELCM